MLLFQTYHQTRWQKIMNSDFWLYELSVWLHTFARSLIAIFIPIFIFQTGYTIQEVIVYYLIYSILDVILSLVARWLIQKIGARWVTIVASIFSLAFFTALYALVPNSWWLLILIAVLSASYDALYWVAHIYLFMKCSKHNNNVSKDASFQLIVKKIAGILAPALGAAVIIFFDRQVLILVSIVFLSLSVIPLFKLKKIEDRPLKAVKSWSEFFKKKDMFQEYIMSALYAIHSTAEWIIWPLFIYISLGNIQAVALLPIIVSFTTIVFIYLAGNSAKKKRGLLIVVGSVSIASIWFLRIIIDSSIFYYTSVFLVGLFSVFISIPLYSSMYEKGEKVDALNTSTYRNTANMLARVIIFAALALLVNVFSVSFIIGAISMLVIAVATYVLGKMFKTRKKYHLSWLKN